MNFKILLSIIYVISSTYITAPTKAYAGPSQQCTQGVDKAIELCDTAKNAAETGNNGMAASLAASASQSFSTSVTAFQMADVTAKSANNLTAASGYCKSTAEKLCQEVCNKAQQSANSMQEPQKSTEISKIRSEFQRCEQEITQRTGLLDKAAKDAGGASRNATETGLAAEQGTPTGEGGGGGMSPMMAGLLGAALGAGAAMLLNKKKEDKNKKEDEDSVVSEDGTVDCSKSGSEVYSDCNEYYVSKCKSDLSSESCQTFSNRYCSSSSSSSTSSTASNSSPATSQSGIIIASAEDKDIKGEGIGSQYCFVSQATNFCATSGRETCPSCLQLQTNKAAVCESNPTLCLAQNSTSDIEAARNSCPSDPLFSNPEYIAGGGATVPGGADLDEPILPGQYASSSDSSSFDDTSGSVAGEGGQVGMVIASAGSASDVADGSRRGGDSSYSGSSSGSGKERYVIGGASSRELASSQARSGSQASRNPTSKGGVMGPSLFSMSSAMIEARCKQRQLAHCSR